MEKDPNFMGSGSGMPQASSMPTAPPSYDEAVTNAGPAGSHPYPAPNAAPYPMTGNAMPMPSHYDPSKPGMHTPMPTDSGAQPLVQQYHQPGSQYQHQQNQPTQAYVQPPTQIHVIQQSIAYAVGPNSLRMKCPSCHADIKTTTVSDHQGSAHICCLVLCLLGCCLCSCLPYCMNSFKSVHHSCPNCKAYIGTWKG